MRGSSHHEYSVLDRGAACLQCKKRKKRCDGVKPVCGPCIRIGTAEQCEFPQPPPPKVKKPKTPPRSKNETLRAQIRLLEDKIARLQSAISSTSHTGSTTNYVDDSSSPSVRGSSVGLQDEMLIDEDQTRRISKISQIPDIPPLAISFSAPSPSSPDTASSPSSKLFQGDFPLPTWTEEIFDVFMRYRHRCGYEIDEQRFSLAFRTSLRANRHRHAQGLRHGHDTSDSESDLDGRRQVKPEELLPAEKTHAGVTGGRLLHPALMNAVLLLGCHFATSNGSASGSGDTILDPSRVSAPSQHYTSRSRDPSQSYYSPTLADTQRLLHYTRLALENALNSADRLHDFLHATFLLVFFYFATGRVSEAQYHSAGLAGFVGACKLNELDVSDQTLHGSEARMLIDSPRDQVDIEERIGLFWNVFILDKYAALVYGSMSTLRDERIWTPWPRSSEEWSIPRHSEFSPSSAWNSTLPALNHLTLSKVELTFRSISIYLLEGVMRLDKSSSVSSRPFGELRTEADLAELTRNYESLRDTAQRIAVWLPDLDLTFIQRDLVSAVASAPALHSRHYYGHQSQSSFSGSMGRASTIGLETNMLDLQTSHMPSPPSSASALYTGGYSTSGSSPLSSTYAFFPSSSASSPALPAPITVFGSGLSSTGLTSNPTPSPCRGLRLLNPLGADLQLGPDPLSSALNANKAVTLHLR
ncbi:uncharacterized protein EI90DRAFT_1296525 [Cantharellus anzutake]|uniref:uncharacterized protein n=1 Tax=Cantharellus anzutake TaxID=1750568 RepID=UPI001907047F|nr:uncharacterized protein EI90DRAFT_1296525 [Cantharellus anzutake]KAF8342021.1 hypothetical protein EI90DRAFT_1296525 [Cantharellus anzutake]